MEISFNFIIQATVVLNKEKHNDEDLNLIYKFILSLDNDTLIDYNFRQTLIGYENDLELYFDILNSLIKIYEFTEDYEKCQKLLIKKNNTIKLTNYVSI
jgi:hypothetical protein